MLTIAEYQINNPMLPQNGMGGSDTSLQNSNNANWVVPNTTNSGIEYSVRLGEQKPLKTTHYKSLEIQKAQKAAQLQLFKRNLLKEVKEELANPSLGIPGLGKFSKRYMRGIRRYKRKRVFAYGFGAISTPRDNYLWYVWRYAHFKLERRGLTA